MLKHLSIRNIVLIDACDIDLEPGVCVLTGETGAGKSILLDALGLTLGARGDSALVRRGQAQGSVTAEFDITDNAVAHAWLVEAGLEDSEELVIRRSVSADGKSRAFVNDQPISNAALKTLGERLVEIHGQHDQRALFEPTRHRAMLDAFAGLEALVQKTSDAHAAWKAAMRAHEAALERIAQARREEDYLRHVAKELAQLDPKVGEEESLSSSRAALMASEKLITMLDEAVRELNQGKGASSAIRSAQRLLARSAFATQESIASVIEQLDQAAEQVDQAVDTLERQAQYAGGSTDTLEKTEERLFALKAAARKYNFTCDELAAYKQDVDNKLKTLASEESELRQLTAAEAEHKRVYADVAAKLSDARKKAAVKLEKIVHAELTPLKMASTRFHVRIEPLNEQAWSAEGMDMVTFEAATNVGKDGVAHFSPLAKIASGGELSRFMLALKVSLAARKGAPTLIFDEIDTGTGGAVADAIGQRLARLGETAQVLVVTHLPQVAARGAQHFTVAKREKAGMVTTSVELLNAKARREELARMLSGATITAEARKAAGKLLEEAV